VLVAFADGYALIAADGRFKLSGDPGDNLSFVGAGRRLEWREVEAELRVGSDQPFLLSP
jgi:hypothetical protein